ncbi:MAG: hypothetical protein U1C96_09615 [Gallionella sp.]|nr:hypothetical protein [Gallionella sp.]
MRTSIKLSICFIALTLSGCQSAPPVPTDKYYRLEAAQGDASATAILHGAIYIAPLSADGPYAERAMLYSTPEQSRELQQYHYRHWNEPPAILLQEHMRASFEAMKLASRVTTIAMGDDIGHVLDARIVRFEKISGANPRAVVSLHLALKKTKPMKMIMERSYSEEVILGDDSQHTYVLACEAGLKKIYERFSRDLKALR